MSLKESDYIEICKKQLEEKFSFGNGHGYTQKDLELLSNYIEEKTGITISLSTLKRLWKNSFKQGPQLATLNALVQTLGYTNWQHFKLENKPKTILKKEKQVPNTFSSRFKIRTAIQKLFLISTLLIFISALWVFYAKKESVISTGTPIIFSSNKTLTKGTPNTVIFNYDVSKIKADSFFIQQSWNKWRREKINPAQNVFSSIYYESGFHRAKLIANDQIIAEKRIHILSDGWEAHSYYNESDDHFIDFKDISFINNGKLHISKDMLQQKNIHLHEKFITRVSNSQVYNISSDNFSLVAKTKLDNNQLNTNCPWFNVLIVTERHIFSIGLKKKGCEAFANYKLGEIYKHGKNTDLSLLGIDVFDWHEIGFDVKNKNATILIDGKPTYTENFKEDFGNIVGLTFIYEGTGSVDYIKLSDQKGNVAFEDNFNR